MDRIIRVSDETHMAAKLYAAAAGMSLAELANAAVLQFITTEEARQRIDAVALARSVMQRSGLGATTSTEAS